MFGMTIGLIFFLDDVNCTGNESSIFDCQYPPSTDCQVFRREEAGAICGVTPGKVASMPTTYIPLFFMKVPVLVRGAQKSIQTIQSQ